MSVPVRSQNDALVFFADYLAQRPLGGTDSPISIKAADLDGNFARCTVIAPEEDPPPYGVEYTERGTILTNISGLPEGAVAREFAVCENGSPKQYWFLTWDEEPQLGGGG
jgi:hypothetical protein